VITNNNYDNNIHAISDQESTRSKNYRNSHIGHCTLTSEALIEEYKAFSISSNITCSIICNFTIAATPYTVHI
jgi:hypothetical protein